MTTPRTVAVTGATGFLGRYIVDVLLRRGCHVIGVVRNPSRVPELAARGVELRKADLAEPERLAEGFAGADAVVSNAALYALGRLVSFRDRNWQEHHRANIDGTCHVVEAAAAAGVRRLVHVSSVIVYQTPMPAHVAEDHPIIPASTKPGPANAYALSKAEAERVVTSLAAEHAIDLTIIRPGGIYGAFDPNFTTLFRRLLGLPVAPFPAMLHTPFAYGGDVAEAIALALETPAAVGRAYNVVGEDRPVWEMADAWGAAGGRVPWIRIPVPIPVRVSYDITRATTELGWTNRPLADGMRETLALDPG
ncbi:MAG TPA: NAD(P)-dependent oxidoreductase [Candidatus Binatia bacterium]|jgi:nucleoside-diphosphate-sugar epimerase|nr:NAD(P)-dependent oxidoreductase [Candidatus Binatia bacterium]